MERQRKKTMEKKFIMTAFGKDRPGIVADVSRVIYENGCNLEDSTMTLLEDEFTIILVFAGREEGALEEQLLRDCRRIERDKGITAFIRALSDEKIETKKPFSAHTLHVEGLDQAGIVYKISRYLADNNVNIANLNSRMSHSPESGAAIYTMDIQIEIPEGASPADLEKGLDLVRDDLNLDISLA